MFQIEEVSKLPFDYYNIIILICVYWCVAETQDTVYFFMYFRGVYRCGICLGSVASLFYLTNIVVSLEVDVLSGMWANAETAAVCAISDRTVSDQGYWPRKIMILNYGVPRLNVTLLAVCLISYSNSAIISVFCL